MIRFFAKGLDPQTAQFGAGVLFFNDPIEIPISQGALANATCDVLTDVLILFPDQPVFFQSVFAVSSLLLPADAGLPIPDHAYLGSVILPKRAIERHDAHLMSVQASAGDKCVYGYVWISGIAELKDFVVVKIGVQQAP